MTQTTENDLNIARDALRRGEEYGRTARDPKILHALAPDDPRRSHALRQTDRAIAPIVQDPETFAARLSDTHHRSHAAIETLDFPSRVSAVSARGALAAFDKERRAAGTSGVSSRAAGRAAIALENLGLSLSGTAPRHVVGNLLSSSADLTDATVLSQRALIWSDDLLSHLALSGRRTLQETAHGFVRAGYLPANDPRAHPSVRTFGEMLDHKSFLEIAKKTIATAAPSLSEAVPGPFKSSAIRTAINRIADAGIACGSSPPRDAQAAFFLDLGDGLERIAMNIHHAHQDSDTAATTAAHGIAGMAASAITRANTFSRDLDKNRSDRDRKTPAAQKIASRASR